MTNADQNAEKPVEQWVTGDEPMTAPQRSYLETLAREANVDIPEGLTKADASTLIDQLQEQTGRRSPEQGDRTASLDDLLDEGIVDQQAAAEVAPRDGDQ